MRPPIDPAELARIERWARLLDSGFRIPGTGIRFGLDSLIGLIPGIGDAAGLAGSAYIVWAAWRLGLPPGALLRMLANIGLDAAVGAVPVLGDLFDVVWKANQRNVRILKDHLR